MKMLKVLSVVLLSSAISLSANAKIKDTSDSDICVALSHLAGTAMEYRQSDRSLVENFLLVEEISKSNLSNKVLGSDDYEFTEKINMYFESVLKVAYHYPFYDIPEIDLKTKNDFIKDNYISCMS